MTVSKKKIEIILAQKGMTEKELAVKSGLCRQMVNAIKQRETCTPKTAGKLAAGLGVSVEEIIEEV